MDYNQRRQSDFKSGGSWIRVKLFRFFNVNFRRISIFFIKFKKNRFFQANFRKKFDFFRQIHKQNSIYPGKFLKNFDIFRQFTQEIQFSRQQLDIYSYLLYLSSKVTTFEHTSST